MFLLSQNELCISTEHAGPLPCCSTIFFTVAQNGQTKHWLQIGPYLIRLFENVKSYFPSLHKFKLLLLNNNPKGIAKLSSAQDSWVQQTRTLNRASFPFNYGTYDPLSQRAQQHSVIICKYQECSKKIWLLGVFQSVK